MPTDIIKINHEDGNDDPMHQFLLKERFPKIINNNRNNQVKLFSLNVFVIKPVSFLRIFQPARPKKEAGSRGQAL